MFIADLFTVVNIQNIHWKQTKCSSKRNTDSQTAVYLYDGILLSNEKEPTNTQNCINKSQKHYVEQKPDIK